MGCGINTVAGQSASGGGPSGPTPDNLETEWEFDWQSVGSFDFKAAGDNTYNIGGYDYTVSSLANATTFAVDPATGLAVVTNDASGLNWSSSSTNAPRGVHVLKDLVSFTSLAHPVTYWWRFGVLNPGPTSGTGVRCGVSCPTGTGFSGVFQATGSVWVPTSPGPGRGYTMVNQASQNIGITNEWPVTTWDVFALRYTSNGLATGWGGTWGGRWPTLNEMVEFGYAVPTTAPTVTNIFFRPETTMGAAAITGTTAISEFTLLSQRITRG